MAHKSPVLAKYTFQHVRLNYLKKISVQSGEILLEISYWTLWMTLFDRKCLLENHGISRGIEELLTNGEVPIYDTK